MMPYHNEASVVHPGGTGNYSSHTAAMEHSGREGKTTTVINRALDTTLTTEVLWGYRHEQWSFTTTAALALKIGTGSVNQFYTVSLDKIHKMPIAAERGKRTTKFDILSPQRVFRAVSSLIWSQGQFGYLRQAGIGTLGVAAGCKAWSVQASLASTGFL